MEKSVRVSEREYSKKMIELTKGFEVRDMPLFLISLLTKALGCRKFILRYGKPHERG